MNARRFASHHPNACALAVFCLAALILFGAGLKGGFQLDDWWWAAAAKRRGLLGLYDGWRDLGLFVRPVVSVVFGLLWRLFGPAPVGYKAFNIVLQVVTAYSLRAIWLRLTGLRDHRLALLVGLTFLVWPTHAETVIWIAGMTDGLSLCVSALALWAYLVALHDKRSSLYALSIVLFASALLAKENALVMPPIAILLGVLVASPQTRARVLLSGIPLLAACGTYLVFRGALIGHIVGGYGSEHGVRAYILGAFGNRMVTNLSNTFLPFAKYLFLSGGFSMVEAALGSVLIGAAGLALRTVPRSARNYDTTVYGIAVWILVASCLELFLLNPQWSQTVFISLETAPLAWPFVILLLAYAGWRLSGPVRTLAQHLATGQALWTFHAAGAFVAMLLARALVYQEQQFAVEIIFLVWVFVTRPVRDDADPMDSRLRLLVFALFFCAYLCLLPSANLPVGIDGQQARFSYLATFFSVMALCAFVCLTVRGVQSRRELMVGIVVAEIPLFLLWIGPWLDSAMVWKRAADEISLLSPARRIYAVTAPGMIGHAVGFLGGLEAVPFVTKGDEHTQVLLVSTVMNGLPGDRIAASAEGKGTFVISVDQKPGKRFAGSAIVVAKSPGWHQVRSRSLQAGRRIELTDLKSSDHVIAIGMEAIKVLR